MALLIAEMVAFNHGKAKAARNCGAASSHGGPGAGHPFDQEPKFELSIHAVVRWSTTDGGTLNLVSYWLAHITSHPRCDRV